MDYAGVMRRRKRFGHLHANLQNRIEWQRFFLREMLAESVALN